MPDKPETYNGKTIEQMWEQVLGAQPLVAEPIVEPSILMSRPVMPQVEAAVAEVSQAASPGRVKCACGYLRWAHYAAIGGGHLQCPDGVGRFTPIPDPGAIPE